MLANSGQGRLKYTLSQSDRTKRSGELRQRDESALLFFLFLEWSLHRHLTLRSNRRSLSLRIGAEALRSPKLAQVRSRRTDETNSPNERSPVLLHSYEFLAFTTLSRPSIHWTDDTVVGDWWKVDRIDRRAEASALTRWSVETRLPLRRHHGEEGRIRAALVPRRIYNDQSESIDECREIEIARKMPRFSSAAMPLVNPASAFRTTWKITLQTSQTSLATKLPFSPTQILLWPKN